MVANSTDENATGPAWDEVWERIKRSTGIKTQRSLAATLGISDASVADAKKRGVFPLGWALRLARRQNLSLDVILLGRNTPGEISPSPAAERKPLYIDSAVELVDEAVKASGCLVNSEQKAALVSIIREELKKKAENLVRALTV
ncbi:helix-turn-helix domain-containing protein [Fundidesulfovibrio putealis]|uniref:helix-turn-helix domain-containing protein n=1 Tax=Fundidesulfovibrio putealis TaxID=270496 RepID=UPI0005BA25F3|nr:helix-turn-helix domain-containing protein [Fundidesulfovibrio putealis]